MRDRRSRRRIHLLSRFVICVVNAAAIGTLFWHPENVIAYGFDVALRGYLVFLGTVMAHEAVHGNLGQSRNTNLWWGRAALLSSMVPFTNFHKTHRLHHAYTNIPDRDPDYFLRSRNTVEIVWHSIAMPHHWFLWLRSRGLLKRAEMTELVLNYLGIVMVYAIVLYFVGPTRLAMGMAPALFVTSLLLWYPFAIKTHEGFSTGSQESRSHNYYGRWMFWFSLGLSMHREHHLQPGLPWLALRKYVKEVPRGRLRILPLRDVQAAPGTR